MKYLASFFAVLLLVNITAQASEQTNSDELRNKYRTKVVTELVPKEYTRDTLKAMVLEQGYVNPNDFDDPKYQAYHQSALNWLKSFIVNSDYSALTALANEYQQKTGQGKSISRGSLEVVGGWSGAIGNYQDRIDNCLNPDVSICDESKYALRAFVKKFNIHIINLAASYIKAIQPFVDGKLQVFDNATGSSQANENN